MALLVNPDDRPLAQAQAREVLSAARNRKLELHVLNARRESDFDTVFADVKRLQVSGLVIGPGSVFYTGINKLAALTVQHAVPAVWQDRGFRTFRRVTAWPAFIPAGFSKAKILPNCQLCRRPSLNWSSI